MSIGPRPTRLGIPTERWNGASGYVVIVLGIAGAAIERGSPSFTAPIEEVVAFWSKYQRELLAQSVMFVLSAGAYLWFAGSLRSMNGLRMCWARTFIMSTAS